MREAPQPEPAQYHRAVDALILQVLNKATEPLAARQIADMLDQPTQAVAQGLAILRRKGLVFRMGKHHNCRWVGGDTMVQDVAVGFPAIIGYYERIDPRIAEILEADYRQFQEQIQGKHILGEYEDK